MERIFLALLIFAAACSHSRKNNQQQADDFSSLAPKYMNEYLSLCEEEKGRLWGRTLCVPMIFLDKNSLKAISNQQDPGKRFRKSDSLYAGRYYGPRMYANTSLTWGGERWSMVLWPLPESKSERIDIVFHEAWHSIQSDLQLPMNNAINGHLDQRDARIWIRLEWNALLLALEEREGRKTHLQNALVFRSLRYQKYEEARTNETILDLNEGLAAYTGTKMRGLSKSETVRFLRKKLNDMPNLLSLTRSSSYFTGPLYGLLLDTTDARWRDALESSAGLGDIARSAFHLDPVREAVLPEDNVLDQYGFGTIASFEAQRARERELKIADYLKRTTHENGLVIRLSENAMQVFDPGKILVVDKNRSVYVFYELKDDWGFLRVEDGALVEKNDKGGVVLVGKPRRFSAREAAGDGWSIKLEKGWVLSPEKNGRMAVEKSN